MKINEYNDMMSYLTRPGTAEEKEVMDKKSEKELADKQMIKLATQPDSRGAYKKAVEQNKQEEKLFENIFDKNGLRVNKK